MRKSLLIGGIALCALSTSVLARAPEDFSAAWSACESGRGNARYEQAVDACWSAYEGAMVKLDYPAALAAASNGCNKYRRADYCTFMLQLPEPVAKGRIVKVASAASQLGRDLQRAASRVHPLDVEDGEGGYVMRALEASARAAGKGANRVESK